MSADNIIMFINFFGGLAIFIYGMSVMADALQKSAGDRVKSLLSMLTSNKYVGVLIGAVVTAIIQSSSATTVMVVGFVNAGILELSQAIGVVMGANVGTTITSWLIASSEWATFLKPTTVAPLLVAIGVLLTFTSKKKKTKSLANFFIGIGLLFIGMEGMSDAVKPLRDSELFVHMFVELSENPLLGMLAGLLVTATIQSSSAAMGILISLASTGAVPMSAAVYIIMGENIGTCITALLSSLGAHKNAKAASYMHLAFNVIGSMWFSIVAVTYFKFFNPDLATVAATATSISIVHTMFNVTNVLVLLPFTNQLVAIGKKLAGITPEDEEIFRSKKESMMHFDERMLATPDYAIDRIFAELTSLSKVTLQNFDLAEQSLLYGKYENFKIIEENEAEINQKVKVLSANLVKILQIDLDTKQSQKVAIYFNALSDIERVGDHIENIAETSIELSDVNQRFTEGARDELKEVFAIARECYELSIEALNENDADKAIKAIQLENDIDTIEETLRNTHKARLVNNECKVEAGIVFLDAVSNLERISDHSNNIASYVVKKHI